MTSSKIVLASHNQGKLREMSEILNELRIEVISQSAFGVPDAMETGLSFVENALLKARNAAQHTGFAAIADDSGLEVDALGGQPGIHSARYAGPKATDQENLEKLLESLKEAPEQQFRARYQCVIVHMHHWRDPTPLICQGTWEGEILLVPQGNGGFGYDPIFYLPEHHCTVAELPPAEKNRLSHRGKALRALLNLLREEG
ncbi:Ham1-like protein [Nitrosococcus oceani ATCC 19707]|uniref:dITP/XTP pyrophosphatase n=2 Tax=Nitrosococcus oceani TaxID=1229 RepID=Q3J8E9_NITOC|nr:RdgB/HAM1 family non-canonical purine NTP pyrophosphatase [Nitrosococcus oceani]ABA58897.1 Ham1-like protein [Nitrosococcus oceani ATCC 19707]EDZ67397.1 non-canonical purine NTP pyrophosphatase, rdgB/HAM1 family [Nitrosococcus oceani AFC27]KFI18697.1 nucleoside-triphosphate diphosphatase [Nitrosococcus oceani C-27]GEM19008.1 non-canonical purine NTP pyrophosphatase [Nitrosococcus oceani]